MELKNKTMAGEQDGDLEVYDRMIDQLQREWNTAPDHPADSEGRRIHFYQSDYLFRRGKRNREIERYRGTRHQRRIQPGGRNAELFFQHQGFPFLSI